MISNKEKEEWHYLAVKKIFALLHKKLQIIRGIFIVLIVLILLEEKINLNLMKKYVKIKMSVELKWHQKKKKILELKQYMKCDKIPYVIYADIESLIRKIDGCANNQEKLSAMKISEYIPCEYSISTIWEFEHVKNKYSLYRGKDCMKRFWASLREHEQRIIGFEKKKMLPLTRKELKNAKLKMQKNVVFPENTS